MASERKLRLRRFVLQALTNDKRSIKFPTARAQGIAGKHRDIPDAVWADLPELRADPLIALPHREGGLSFVINGRTRNGEPIIVDVRDGEVHTITPRHVLSGALLAERSRILR